MADIISFKLKNTYDRELRARNPAFQSSKGYPAVRDPAAETPRGVLPQTLSEADLHKLRLHYGPALVS